MFIVSNITKKNPSWPYIVLIHASFNAISMGSTFIDIPKDLTFLELYWSINSHFKYLALKAKCGINLLVFLLLPNPSTLSLAFSQLLYDFALPSPSKSSLSELIFHSFSDSKPSKILSEHKSTSKLSIYSFSISLTNLNHSSL